MPHFLYLSVGLHFSKKKIMLVLYFFVAGNFSEILEFSEKKNHKKIELGNAYKEIPQLCYKLVIVAN